MARTNSDDLLMEDDLAAAFFGTDEDTSPVAKEAVEEISVEPEEEVSSSEAVEDEWDNTNTDDFPGQLAVDVYETADKLVVKARTAGIAETAEAYIEISGVRILFPVTSPLR